MAVEDLLFIDEFPIKTNLSSTFWGIYLRLITRGSRAPQLQETWETWPLVDPLDFGGVGDESAAYPDWARCEDEIPMGNGRFWGSM